MQGLKYARIQELGGKGMINLPPRPYMRPAMESQQAEIMERFDQAILKASI
jgi:phage gpG-like protein